MGATRQGFNLFRWVCLRGAWFEIRRGRWRGVRRYVFRDTLTPIICWASGDHEFYWQPDPVNEPEEVFCNWCHLRKPSAAPAPAQPAAEGEGCPTCGDTRWACSTCGCASDD